MPPYPSLQTFLPQVRWTYVQCCFEWTEEWSSAEVSLTVKSDLESLQDPGPWLLDSNSPRCRQEHRLASPRMLFRCAQYDTSVLYPSVETLCWCMWNASSARTFAAKEEAHCLMYYYDVPQRYQRSLRPSLWVCVVPATMEWKVLSPAVPWHAART